MAEPSVVAFVPDLMDRSRVASAFPQTTFVTSAAELSAADIVIVDLARPGAIESVRGMGGRVIGFGPHVDAEVLARAREAGAEAMPRSEFFRRLSDPATL